MSKKNALVALSTMLLLMVAAPALAAAPVQGEGGADVNSVRVAIAIASAFGMGIASGLCGLAQGRAVSAACEGMARNPSAGGQIRGSLIIGLVLIESLAIYTLLIGLLLIFQRWGGA